MTGAVSTVFIDQARKERLATTLSDMLRSSVSGVVVTDGASGGVSRRIRGATSITRTNDPLCIVDGMPVEPDQGGTQSWLNPNDIESIAVLKDASVTAICVTRGADGQVVIKTKREELPSLLVSVPGGPTAPRKQGEKRVRTGQNGQFFVFLGAGCDRPALENREPTLHRPCPSFSWKSSTS